MMEFTTKNPKYFYSPTDFNQLKVLEDNFQLILSELQALRANSADGYWLDTFPHYLTNTSKSKWQVFTFSFFGIKHPLNRKYCPKTASVIDSIPNLVSADFSYLPAHTHVKPHKGFTKMVLRVHLGLIIPKGDCGLRVGNEIRGWEEGKLIVFDDSFEHEAWNNSDYDRFILMLDIANPLWGYAASEICKYKIEHMEDKFMLEMFSKEQWLDYFKKGEFYSFK